MLCLSASLAAAQEAAPEANKVLTLSSRASIYNLAPYIKTIPADKQKGLGGFDDALKSFKEGKGTASEDQSEDAPLFLKNSAADGLWLFVNVYNRSQSRTRWILNLNTLYKGTLGLPEAMAIFTNQSPEPLLVDGRSIKNKKHLSGQNKNAVPITIEPGQQTTIALFIDTVPGSILSLYPELKEFGVYKSSIEGNSSQGTLIKIAFILLLITYALSWNNHKKNIIPFVLALYLTTQLGIFLISDELISFGNNTLLEYATLLHIIAAICALLITKYVLLSGASEKLARYLLIGAILVLTAISFILIGFDTSFAALDVFALRILPVLCALTVAGLSILVAFKKNRPQAFLFACGWMILFFGAVATEAFKSGLMPFSAIGVNLYWLAFAVHISLISFATLRFISVSEDNARKEIARRKRKTEEDNEIRKTKEQADQTRMFSIMKREKELIADLLNREADRRQALRLAKEIADKANKAKSDFLAVISHEIRTPMTGVMGMIRLLIDTPLNERQQEYVRTIQYSGEALLTLLNDILDLSKAEEGKMTIETLDFDLKKLVDSVVLLMSGRAEEKKLLLKADIQSGTPPFLKGDPTRLRQIFLNLVSNAIKFTESGTVTVTVKVNDNNGKKPRIYFAVTDTGMGIPEDVQKKLFTPYAQADASISRNFGGTGLGLAICKRLVDAMGGNIQLQSTPGKGTTFYFIIPMDIGTEQRQSAPVQKSESAPMRILVVDDNAINLKVVSGLLEKEHHRIVTCNSAEAAMQEIAKSMFDVILMDMEMPQIDGVTATKMIRALPDPEKSRIAIVAMTANIRREDIQRCKDAGMNDHIAKPISPESLRALLTQINKQVNPATAGHAKPAQPQAQLKVVTTEAPAPATAPASNGDARQYFSTDMIDSLKSSLGAAQMDDMMQSLYQKTDELITALEKAVKEKDIVAIATRGHDIKGMTANFGLTHTSDIAGQIEKQAKQKGDIQALAALAEKLRPSYEQTRIYLDQFLKA